MESIALNVRVPDFDIRVAVTVAIALVRTILHTVVLTVAMRASDVLLGFLFRLLEGLGCWAFPLLCE